MRDRIEVAKREIEQADFARALRTLDRALWECKANLDTDGLVEIRQLLESLREQLSGRKRRQCDYLIYAAQQNIAFFSRRAPERAAPERTLRPPEQLAAQPSAPPVEVQVALPSRSRLEELEQKHEALKAEFAERLQLLEQELVELRLILPASAPGPAPAKAEPEPAEVPPAVEAATPVPPPPPVEPPTPVPAPSVAPPTPTPVTARPAPPAPVVPPAGPPTPPRPPKSPGPTIVERLERYDLLGARGLALVGGIVMLLGVVFLFILAANRGWFGPGARVASGAIVAVLLVGVGARLKARYGQYEAAVAAVATGIAAAYATLAAATLLYEMLPAWGALIVASGIAGGASAIAVKWKAELVGALGLLGALTSPALLAIDDGVSSQGTAFALLVFVGAVGVAAWMRWQWLLALAAADAAAQTVWLIAAGDVGDAAPIVVSHVAAAALLSAAIAWQPAEHPERRDWLAVPLVGAATILAISTSRLYESDAHAGVAVLVAAILATGISTLLAQRVRVLGMVVAAAAAVLAIAAVGVWADGEVASGDVLAIVVAATASLALLGGAIGWQLLRTDEGLDEIAGMLVTASTGLVLASSYLLADADRDRGIALLVAALVAAGSAAALLRPARDLAQVVGSAALLLVAVATADLSSGRNLAIALSAQAVALAVVGNRLGNVRHELASLAYLGFGLAHVLFVDLGWENGHPDLELAAPPLFALAAAALSIGLLLPATRRDRPSVGLLSALNPLWEALFAARVPLRAWLATLGFLLAALGTDGLASGRALTFVWAVEAALLAAAAYFLHEVRLQPFALAALALALAHVLTHDAVPKAIFEERGFDFVEPVPSLAAVIAATGVVAATAFVKGRGLALLGPLAGPERYLLLLRRRHRPLARWLVVGVIALVLDAAGLLLVAADYDIGQVAATVLWGCAALAVVTVCARERWLAELGAGWALLAIAALKAVEFDADELTYRAGGWSVFLVAAPVVLSGLATRWFLTPAGEPLDGLAAATGAASLGLAAWGLARLTGSDLALGLTLLGVAAGYTGLAAIPYARWHAGGDPQRPWLRRLTTIYWLLALVALLSGEALAISGSAGITAAYAATAAALAIASVALGEPRLRLAGFVILCVTTLGALAVVTPPTRFVDASAHPGTALWALVAAVAAWVVFARLSERLPSIEQEWLWVVAGVLGVYTLSLGILEVAERASGASITTDFQRGHTVVSAVWAVIALGLLAAGLETERARVRWAGLGLFGVALGKLFLYDLRTLSSITRALSFLAVGTLLLAAAFFVQRLAERARPG